MKVLNICLSLTLNAVALSDVSSSEQQYSSVLKPLISYLYNNPTSFFSFSFSGPQLEWLDKNHPEFLQLLKELVARKQVEILGGGYYNPVFPLLSPVDRTGQIDLLTSDIRRITGKRPRGMSILSSAWDHSLVPCFQNCGMEWVHLDSSIIPPKSRLYLPLILNEQGKTLKVLPSYRNLDSVLQKELSADAYLSLLIKQAEKASRSGSYVGPAQERVVFINAEVSYMEPLVMSGWIEELYKACRQEFSAKARFCLPTEYLHRAEDFVPSYINTGLREDIAKWSSVSYEPVENKSSFSLTVNNFLLTYKRFRSLYNRQVFISMLISACHGDKARKSAARQALWKAQTGEALICSPEGIFANSAMRQTSYKHLTEAEKYIREASVFKESVTSFDYNADGHNEYICAMEKYTACISPHAAEINELNIMHNTGNYADNLSRIEKFDKVSDNYERGLFIDHVFDKAEFADYKKGLPTGCGIFSRVLFKETEFNGQKKEIKLKGEGTYSNLNLPVSLRKRYLMNSNGFSVQYVLKNEGPIAFKGNFVVESNFAQTEFSAAVSSSYKAELISSGSATSFEEITKPVTQKQVSFVQITDKSNDISFVYEPNEEAGFTCRPLYFKRPAAGFSSPQVAGTTFVASLFWDIDLAAGMEMEKTISFSIVVPKKRRKKTESKANN